MNVGIEMGIGCGGAIIKEKKILLTKRVSSKKNSPNCWTFPAGSLEKSDVTLAAAAAREVKEEVGIDFKPNKKLGFYESEKDGTRFIGFIFLGEWSGDVKPLETEVSEIGWFTYAETKKLDIAFCYDKAIDDLYESGLIK